MARINYEFYDKKNIYDDGEIELKVYEYYKNDKDPKYYDETMFYLTTDIRANILNWYPFDKNKSVLEVGAGCGTITEMLCRSCKHVTSVEGSKRRAEILFERCKQYDNLDVYVANLNKLKIQEKFDYIVLIGVFEYAKMFCNTNNPFIDFLSNLKKMLKKDGKIIIAIENRYGIKYMAGNTEDHFGESYVGLLGYENLNIQTFGKNELISIIKKVGFTKYKFFYPFPDYKMPSVIYSDDYLPKLFDCYNLPIYNHGEQHYQFNPRMVLPGIIENNMFSFFANSFLIEIGFDNSEFADVIFAKHQPYRISKYNTITLINKNKKVYKISSFSDANNHLNSIEKNHCLINKNGIPICKIKKERESIDIEYINGDTVYEKICNLLLINDKNEILNEIDKYVKFLKDECSIDKKIMNPISTKLLEIYNDKKTKILKCGLLDLNMGNVIVKNDEYVLIDQEWLCEEELPTEYAIYFSIKLLFEAVPNISNLIDDKNLYKKYEISDIKQNIFNEISIDFFDKKMKYKDIDIFKKLVHNSNILLESDMISQYEKNVIPSIRNDYEKTIIPNICDGYEKEIKRISELQQNIVSENQKIIHSFSWKITKPLRFIVKILKKR